MFVPARARWDRMARVEPYYAVLSHPRFLRSQLGANLTPFFETGEGDVARLLAAIHSIDGRAAIREVLEFGCGPGRLLPAFARRGMAVMAVDHSPEMLALARANAGNAEVVFATSIDTARRFDLVTMTHVLQHMTPSDGTRVIREVAQRVRRGGYLYLDLPFRSSRSTSSRTALRLRTEIPLLNALANRAKGRPSAAPVSFLHVHSLDEITATLLQNGMEILHVAIHEENELMTASILARAAGSVNPATAEPVAQEQEHVASDRISPRELLQTLTVEELNERAERYFARIDSFDAQLAKPFASVAEAPDMLISLGTVLSAMKLAPGMTVLDFGGGTGWLSRVLSQLGCRVILCDVSPTALRIAREAHAQHAIEYLLFDGHRLALEDASVDRILCFDAFHHVPNPEEILRECSRVLRPGGLAAFSEPGPQHSQSAQSQFEMRVHGVLENDVDIREIWGIARECGFDDLRIAAFDGAPPYLKLDDFEELLDGGPALQSAAQHLRQFVSTVRTFVLHKSGEEARDSRTIEGLRSRVDIDLAPVVIAGEWTPFTAIVENIGTATWLPSATEIGGVTLGTHLYRDGELLDFDFAWNALSDQPLPPGSAITMQGLLPPLAPGRYRLEFGCVAKQVTWFEQVGSPLTTVTVDCVARSG